MRSEFGNHRMARPIDLFLESFDPADHLDAAALADPEPEIAAPAAAPDADPTATPALISLPPAPHEAQVALASGPVGAPASAQAWGQPPNVSSLQSLPTPDVLALVQVSEQAPDARHDGVDDHGSQDDAGNRMADFDFIARHDNFVQRMEAQWARMSEMSERMETLRGRPTAQPGFPTYSGDFYYAQEMEIEFLQEQIRILSELTQEEMETALLADSGSGLPAPEDESAAETARLARQNNEAAQSLATWPAPSETAPRAPVWSSAGIETNSRPVQTVVIEGQASQLPADAEGNRLQIDADGMALIWTRDGGVIALGRLDSGFAAELGSATVLQGSLLQRVAIAAGGAGTVPLADALAAGSRVASGVASGVLSGMASEAAVIGRTLLNPALALALVPSVIGQRQEVVLAEGVRYVHQGDEAWGRLEERDTHGNWRLTDDRVLLAEGMGYVSVLTEEQVNQLQAPTVTPAGNPNPPTLLPLPVADPRAGVLPPVVAATPVPTLPGLEAAPQPSAEDLLIDKSNSEILGDSLRAAGIRPPGSGYEAHHIVPTRAGDERMEALRQRLIDMGLDLNDAANGVWLPGPDASADATEAYHRRLNNSDYNEAVVAAFRGVETLAEARDVLSRIGSKLQEGGNAFPGVRPRS